MNISALSTDLAQTQLQETAAVQVQKLAMNSVENQGVALVKMMGEVVTDPALGNMVDVQA